MGLKTTSKDDVIKVLNHFAKNPSALAAIKGVVGETINEDAKSTANQIKSASKYGDKGVYPLNKIYRNLTSDIKSGAGKSELLTRFKKSALMV